LSVLIIVTAICLLPRVIKNFGLSTGDHRLQTSRAVNSPSPHYSNPPAFRSPEVKNLHKETVAKVLSALATPITFYGKILDQNGEPVSEADVDYGTIDRFDESGSDYHSKSDENGSFYLTGVKGAVLTVGVRKDGYYNIHGKSDAAFAYGVGADATRKPPPTRENPAIFILQKQGPTELLVRAGGGQIDVPKDGRALAFDFATGRIGSGDLQIQTWVGDRNQRQFDWSYQLSIPGGGLIERTGQFDFEAPIDGYQASVELRMPATSEKWSSDVPKDYFARLPNGTYARFSIEFYAGNRNFVVLTSYLNPAPGSRNLEFDPSKQIKIK
jgi:hypothetical protein